MYFSTFINELLIQIMIFICCGCFLSRCLVRISVQFQIYTVTMIEMFNIINIIINNFLLQI